MMPSDLIDRWNALGERVYRRRWWIRAAAAVVLLPWFGHFAYTRMATMPPLPPISPEDWNFDFTINKPPPELDRTKELAAAVLALPANPTISVPTTAPAGMQWVAWQDKDKPAQPTLRPAPPSFDARFALNGPWSPSTRLIQGEVVKYLELPATQSAMATIAELANQPLWFTISGGTNTGQVAFPEARQLARLYTTRSRYYLEEKKDFAWAVNDLHTVLQLAWNLEDDGVTISMVVGAACRALVMNEIILWSREQDFDRNQARMLIQLLDTYTYHPNEIFAVALRGEIRWQKKWVDKMYTKNEGGDGWAVFQGGDIRRPKDWPRLSLNLFSPLLDDRATSLNKHAALMEYRIRMIQNPYTFAQKAFEQNLDFGLSCPTSNYLFMINRISWPSQWRIFQYLMRTEAENEAARTAIALSVYRHEHGCYPQQLSELVPDYLARLPHDPFNEEPLRYRLETADDYVLYSIGENGIDDGGREPDPNIPQSHDLVFPRKRSEPNANVEYVLIPTKSAAQPNGGGGTETDKEEGGQ